MLKSDLPENWYLASIEDITLPCSTTQPQKDPEANFVYLDIGSIDNLSNTVNQPKYFLGKDAPSRARRLVKEGDILFSTVRTYLKNIARVPSEFDGVLTSTGVAVLRARQGIESDYLFRYVLNDSFIKSIQRFPPL